MEVFKESLNRVGSIKKALKETQDDKKVLTSNEFLEITRDTYGSPEGYFQVRSGLVHWSSAIEKLGFIIPENLTPTFKKIMCDLTDELLPIRKKFVEEESNKIFS